MPSHTTSGTVNTGGGIGDTALQRATNQLSQSPWQFTPFGKTSATNFGNAFPNVVQGFGGQGAFENELIASGSVIGGATGVTPAGQYQALKAKYPSVFTGITDEIANLLLGLLTPNNYQMTGTGATAPPMSGLGQTTGALTAGLGPLSPTFQSEVATAENTLRRMFTPEEVQSMVGFRNEAGLVDPKTAMDRIVQASQRHVSFAPESEVTPVGGSTPGPASWNNAVSAQFGQSGVGLEGDLDGDGVVTVQDLVIARERDARAAGGTTGANIPVGEAAPAGTVAALTSRIGTMSQGFQNNITAWEQELGPFTEAEINEIATYRNEAGTLVPETGLNIVANRKQAAEMDARAARAASGTTPASTLDALELRVGTLSQGFRNNFAAWEQDLGPFTDSEINEIATYRNEAGTLSPALGLSVVANRKQNAAAAATGGGTSLINAAESRIEEGTDRNRRWRTVGTVVDVATTIAQKVGIPAPSVGRLVEVVGPIIEEVAPIIWGAIETAGDLAGTAAGDTRLTVTTDNALMQALRDRGFDVDTPEMTKFIQEMTDWIASGGEGGTAVVEFETFRQAGDTGSGSTSVTRGDLPRWGVRRQGQGLGKQGGGDVPEGNPNKFGDGSGDGTTVVEPRDDLRITGDTGETPEARAAREAAAETARIAAEAEAARIAAEAEAKAAAAPALPAGNLGSFVSWLERKAKSGTAAGAGETEQREALVALTTQLKKVVEIQTLRNSAATRRAAGDDATAAVEEARADALASGLPSAANEYSGDIATLIESLGKAASGEMEAEEGLFDEGSATTLLKGFLESTFGESSDTGVQSLADTILKALTGTTEGAVTGATYAPVPVGTTGRTFTPTTGNPQDEARTIINAHFGESGPGLAANAEAIRADLNQDGVINILDLSLAAQLPGVVYPVTPSGVAIPAQSAQLTGALAGLAGEPPSGMTAGPTSTESFIAGATVAAGPVENTLAALRVGLGRLSPEFESEVAAAEGRLGRNFTDAEVRRMVTFRNQAGLIDPKTAMDQIVAEAPPDVTSIISDLTKVTGTGATTAVAAPTVTAPTVGGVTETTALDKVISDLRDQTGVTAGTTIAAPTVTAPTVGGPAGVVGPVDNTLAALRGSLGPLSPEFESEVATAEGRLRRNFTNAEVRRMVTFRNQAGLIDPKTAMDQIVAEAPPDLTSIIADLTKQTGATAGTTVAAPSITAPTVGGVTETTALDKVISDLTSQTGVTSATSTAVAAPDVGAATVATPTTLEEKLGGQADLLNAFAPTTADTTVNVGNRTQGPVSNTIAALRGGLGPLSPVFEGEVATAEGRLGGNFTTAEIDRIIRFRTSTGAVDPKTAMDQIVAEAPPNVARITKDLTSFNAATSGGVYADPAQRAIEQLLAIAMGRTTPEQMAAEDAALALTRRSAKGTLAQDPFNTGGRGITGSPVATALAARYQNEQLANTVDELQKQRYQGQQAALQVLPQIQAQYAGMNLQALTAGGGFAAQAAALQERASEIMAQLNVDKATADTMARLEATKAASAQLTAQYGVAQGALTEQARLDQQAALTEAELALQAGTATTELGLRKALANVDNQLKALVEAGGLETGKLELEQARANLEAELASRGAISEAELGVQAGTATAELGLRKALADVDNQLRALTAAGGFETERLELEQTRANLEAELASRAAISAAELALQAGTATAELDLRQALANVDNQLRALTVAGGFETTKLELEQARANLQAELASRGAISEAELAVQAGTATAALGVEQAKANMQARIDALTAAGNLSQERERSLLDAAKSADELRLAAAVAQEKGDQEDVRLLMDRAAQVENTALAQAELEIQARELEEQTQGKSIDQLLALLRETTTAGMAAADITSREELTTREQKLDLRKTGFSVLADFVTDVQQQELLRADIDDKLRQRGFDNFVNLATFLHGAAMDRAKIDALVTDSTLQGYGIQREAFEAVEELAIQRAHVMAGIEDARARLAIAQAEEARAPAGEARLAAAERRAAEEGRLKSWENWAKAIDAVGSSLGGSNWSEDLLGEIKGLFGKDDMTEEEFYAGILGKE